MSDFFPRKKKPTVNQSGAGTGSVLCGAGLNNRGLRVRIFQDQQKGNEGGIKGSFVLLDVGENKHSPSLRPLLHRATNAEEILQVLRQAFAGCVSVVNTNILALEPQGVSGAIP